MKIVEPDRDALILKDRVKDFDESFVEPKADRIGVFWERPGVREVEEDLWRNHCERAPMSRSDSLLPSARLVPVKLTKNL